MDAWEIPLLLYSIELNKSKQVIFQQTMWRLEPTAMHICQFGLGMGKGGVGR